MTLAGLVPAARVLNLAAQIQQISAPTFFEQPRAEFVASQFCSENLEDVAVDDSGNVLARLPGRSLKLPVVVSAHLDTVFPKDVSLELIKEEDRWQGPGIGDNSLGVAGLLGLVWWLRENSVALDGDLWLVANTGEEGLGNLKGMRRVVERFGDQVSAYIVLEGMAYGKIYNQSLGVHRLRVSCQGPGGHSWMDYGQPSAIQGLAEVIVRLSSIAIPDNPRTTMNVGRIWGGTSINTIAAEACLELDLRSSDPQVLSALVDQVLATINIFPKENGLHMLVEEIGARPAGSIPGDHSLVKMAVRAIERQGDTPEVTIGSTDANIPHSLGLPAICIGLTHGGSAHTPGEYILLEPLERGLRQLFELVQDVFVTA